MTPAEAEKLLEECVARLGEHFEAVQLLGTWTEEGATYCSKRGTGNFFARLAICREFIETNTADDAATLIAEKLDPPL